LNSGNELWSPIGFRHIQGLGQVLHGCLLIPCGEIRSTDVLKHRGNPGSIMSLLSQGQRQFQLLERLTNLPQRFRGLCRLHESPAPLLDLAGLFIELGSLFPRCEGLFERAPLIGLRALLHQRLRRRRAGDHWSGSLDQRNGDRDGQSKQGACRPSCRRL